MPAVALDWDDTLMGGSRHGTPGVWLPGAVAALRFFRRQGLSVVVHSARAQWDGGFAEIAGRCAELKLVEGDGFSIVGKPAAGVYLDDRGVCFPGDWSRVSLRDVAAAARS